MTPTCISRSQLLSLRTSLLVINNFASDTMTMTQQEKKKNSHHYCQPSLDKDVSISSAISNHICSKQSENIATTRHESSLQQLSITFPKTIAGLRRTRSTLNLPLVSQHGLLRLHRRPITPQSTLAACLHWLPSYIL